MVTLLYGLGFQWYELATRVPMEIALTLLGATTIVTTVVLTIALLVLDTMLRRTHET